ncbi:hypothetical protein ACG33_09795 [Steroidobacter denitrificans]|uniref:HTH tetR-type domain-containing protein n=1 Tax=Steroidobacter denitrificans TaxID=465721 RepID=A0A127FAD5_STEDE|nr:TetR/AcrR family transcriptional regulator [Steroidobacter denitrificans]AMN47384.1 hypothetical protein ACG33_09795 [Steroidobacter denitrificans]
MTSHSQTSRIDARAEAQRRRILTAAQKCFTEHGFHAASMAMIADTAEMSAGLIYRYFKSKSEIIQAIIERQLEVIRRELAQVHVPSGDLAESIVESLAERKSVDEDSMGTTLFLEISAQATRDPQTAAALAEFDTVLGVEIGNWLSGSPAQGGYGLPKSTLPTRVLLFTCLLEGIKMRLIREPQIDQALLKDALHLILPALLEPEEGPLVPAGTVSKTAPLTRRCRGSSRRP